MKNIIYALSSLILIMVLMYSCHKEGGADKKSDDNPKPKILNDYLPLKVGAKYKYKYKYYNSYRYYQSTITEEECIWDFLSVSKDTPFVYQVKITKNGYLVNVKDFGTPEQIIKDTTFIKDETSITTFEDKPGGKVQTPLGLFPRYLETDITDTCYGSRSGTNGNGLCLRKDVGIISCSTSWGLYSDYYSVTYTLIQGPYY